MQIQFRQPFQFLHSVSWSKSPIRIYTELNLIGRKVRTDMTEQSQFFFKVDRTDFEFDTTETYIHFRFYLRQHFIEVAHPDKAVNRNPCFSARESGIPQSPISRMKVTDGGFKSEKDRRILTQSAHIQSPILLFHFPTGCS